MNAKLMNLVSSVALAVVAVMSTTPTEASSNTADSITINSQIDNSQPFDVASAHNSEERIALMSLLMM